jgi:polysaccharide export outer membrane protein
MEHDRVRLSTGRTLRRLMAFATRAGILPALALGLWVAGCGTTSPQYAELPPVDPADAAAAATNNPPNPDTFILREGDTVRVMFPGAPSLDIQQAIRRDGKISMKLIGEFQAAGMTPSAMEKELIKLYGPQLQTKEVNVSVEASAFVVYVSGAVLRPGKVLADRPLNALEAIMEAGGFDTTKANMKKVSIIRNDNGASQHFTVNLKGALVGESTQIFKLKPLDIIFVPEKFQWF